MKMEKKVLIALILLVPFVFWLSFILVPKPDPEINEFSTWALGEDWESIETRDIPARWNERHGDLFELNIDDDLREGNKRMYEVWKEHKLK